MRVAVLLFWRRKGVLLDSIYGMGISLRSTPFNLNLDKREAEG
jgi:hypothetical protein